MHGHIYLFIYMFIYIHYSIYIFQTVRRARAVNAQTSDRTVAVHWSVYITALKTANLVLILCFHWERYQHGTAGTVPARL